VHNTHLGTVYNVRCTYVFDCSKYHSCCVVAEAENCMPEFESGM
jgi:hypothetical protein